MNIFGSIFAAISPHLIELFSAGVLALVAWLATTVKARWGIEIEARHREALHSAIMSGVRAALGRGMAPNLVMEYAVQYAKGSVPDAIKKLGPSKDVLNLLAQAKIQEVKAETQEGDK